MENTHLSSRNSLNSSLGASEFKRYAEGWLLDCEIRQHSARTLALRRLILEKFLWWLKQYEIGAVDTLTLRKFLAYITNGHKEPGGRWGNPKENQPVTPATIQLYHRHLRACLNWIVEEGGIDASPMAKVKPPIDRPDQIQPFTPEQVDAVLAAARRSKHPRRDEAICLFLLDTGVRVSEMCALKFGQLEMVTRSAVVEGKGGKKRSVYYGRRTAKALWAYLREEERTPEEPLFKSDNGKNIGEALTPNGVLQMLGRLASAAKIETIRVSPHTFRHTFAVWFLRDGGNQFTLMSLLGHTDVKMTQRYVAFAQADIASQHRQHSPVDRMK
ncbi:MAG TPA: tyrosine-type recombinase/integrase [Chthonomonadaceae bacterium]|nr:tyrosine-type recombinase/integrase [Chthonomonadaceae bacterium]